MSDDGYKPVRDAAKKPYLVVSAAIYVAGNWYHRGDEVQLDKEQAKEWLTKNAVEALHDATMPVDLDPAPPAEGDDVH